MTLQELLAKRNELAGKIQERAKRYQEARSQNKPGFDSPEDEKAWQALNTEHDQVLADLRQAERDDAVAQRAKQLAEQSEQSRRSDGRPGLDDAVPGLDGDTYGDVFGRDRSAASEFAKQQEKRRLAFGAYWLRNLLADRSQVPDEMRQAAHDLKLDLTSDSLHFRTLPTQGIRQLQHRLKSMNHEQRIDYLLSEKRDNLSSVTTGAGVELVPITFVNMLETAILTYGDMLSAIDTITTDSAEEMKWPTMDDTDNMGSWRANETTDTQFDENPLFDRLTWGAHELDSNLIKIPWILELRAMFDVESIIAQALGERIGRSLNYGCTLGDGDNLPIGILDDDDGAPVGAYTVLSNAISYNDFVELEHSVDPAYRRSGSYMLNDRTILNVRLMKDSEGRPLWQPSLQLGQPDRLNGYALVMNNDMPHTLEPGADIATFGDHRKYKLRRVRTLRLVVARERYVEDRMTGVFVYTAADGRLLRFANDDRCAVKKLQVGPESSGD